MPVKAHVTSLEALETFRAHLIVYLTKARPTLDEVSADVMRTRIWLGEEQREHWENQMRRCRRELQEAQQALFSARLSTFRKETSAEQMAVHRTRLACDAAEEKLKIVKKWDRDFDGRVEPLLKQMEKLHTVLAHDMVQALAFLSQAIKTLTEYADIRSRAVQPPAVPSPHNDLPDNARDAVQK